MKKMDLSVKEPLLDDSEVKQTPSATNGSTSLAAYYNKKIYEQDSFEVQELNKNKPINILYDKMFYGRVNLKNEAIIVDATQLKTKLIKNKEASFTNFVMDAQNDFFSYWDYLKKINKVFKGGLLADITVTSAYVDPGACYFYYMNNVFESVKKLITEKNAKVTNFTDFLYQFIEYVDSVTPNIPILFSSYIRSRMADPLISGMCLDVKSLDPTIDSVKFDKILEDQNYALFKITAMKFGFFPDKHIPWRLWADIDSPAMKPYMDKYSLTQDNLYQKNYISANSYDLELLRFYLIQFYNTFVANKTQPISDVYRLCYEGEVARLKKQKNSLVQLPHESVIGDKEFEKLLLKLYVYIKVRENNYSWDKSKFENVVFNFIQVKEALDTVGALRYITPLVTVPAAYDFKQRNFRFY
jgi:hypothetical protein